MVAHRLLAVKTWVATSPGARAAGATSHRRLRRCEPYRHSHRRVWWCEVSDEEQLGAVGELDEVAGRDDPVHAVVEVLLHDVVHVG